MSKYIPAYTSGGTGISVEVTISSTTPVYSAYTNTLIGYGPISWNTSSDAPIGHKNFGKDYHGIVVDSNGHHAAHRHY